MATKRKRSKAKKGAARSAGQRRKERRFITSSTYMAPWVATVGMIGSLVLGAGVFGLWVVDPPFDWASYLVAGGGFGLGVALWFGQPAESAVSVGDAGIAVEDGREVVRIPWCDMKSLGLVGGNMVIKGEDSSARFSVAANDAAAAWALKEAAQRVPDVVDVDKSATEKLPRPSPEQGLEQDVIDDQVTGLHCAASDKPIKLDEEARLCANCGQVYHEAQVPETCVTCQTTLSGRTLRA